MGEGRWARRGGGRGGAVGEGRAVDGGGWVNREYKSSSVGMSGMDRRGGAKVLWLRR